VIDTEQRPVLAGFLALLAVAVVGGLLGGLALVFGGGIFGLGGDDSDSAEPAARETLYLPEPTPTETEEPEPTAETTTGDADAEETEEPEPEGIVLNAAQTSVAPMAQIDLSGTYDAPDGAFLQVQRFEDDEWVDFPVTVPVNGKTFSTYVQTGRSGPNKFRVVDTDSGTESNEVEITVG
jgi:hypothetical protein